MAIVYGIKNCDTVKKALKWLCANGIAHTFVDFRAEGLSTRQIQTWLETLGWEMLINKRSTTWKNLSEDERSNLSIALIEKHPTLIKRPVLERGDQIYVGFKEEIYQEIFKDV